MKGGYSTIHRAAFEGDVPRIQAILKRDKSKLLTVDETGGTPLFQAVIGGHLLAVKTLIESGAKLNTFDYSGFTVLDFAQNPQIIKFLKANGAIVPTITELQDAILANDLPRVVQAILKDKKSVNTPNFDFKFPLHLAIRMGNPEMVALIAKAGADVNQPDKSGCPPIWYAKDLPEIKQILLSFGANEFDDAMIPPDLAATELHNVAFDDELDEFDTLEDLPDFASHIDLTDRLGDTPLHKAIYAGNVKYVSWLIAHGASLDIPNAEGVLPFDLALTSDSGKFEIVKALIQGGADVNAALNPNVETPLHVAVSAKNKALVELLLAKGAKVDEQNLQGLTPLHMAAQLQAADIAQVLLSHGANPEITDNLQMNVIDHAKMNYKHTPFSKQLKQFIAWPKPYINKFNAVVRKFLSEQLHIAKQQNKKFILLLGEQHGLFKLYQLEKQIVQIAKELGIDSLYAEHSSEDEAQFPIHFLAKKLNINIIAVDTLRADESEDASVDARNVFIAQNISQHNRDGVFITGAEHLKGLLSPGASQIDPKQYHIVPINLECFTALPDNPSEEVLFARDKQKVIQVTTTDKCLSPTATVLAKWNPRQQPASVASLKETKRALVLPAPIAKRVKHPDEVEPLVGRSVKTLVKRYDALPKRPLPDIAKQSSGKKRIAPSRKKDVD